MSEEKKNQPQVRDLEPIKDAKGGNGSGRGGQTGGNGRGG